MGDEEKGKQLCHDTNASVLTLPSTWTQVNLEYDVEEDHLGASRLGGDAGDLALGEGGLVEAFRGGPGMVVDRDSAEAYEEIRERIINEQRYLQAIYPSAPLPSSTSVLEVQRLSFQVRALKVSLFAL